MNNPCELCEDYYKCSVYNEQTDRYDFTQCDKRKQWELDTFPPTHEFWQLRRPYIRSAESA